QKLEGQSQTVIVDGGRGVGRVTKPGLAGQVGEAAINPIPRKMIETEVPKVAGQLGYKGGLHVEISVPEGEALAEKTFNPKLGIVGGLSILGTSGIVEPMSE
ncbi:cobalt-precorrin-5B (C(1))-methyltransferase, partial [Eubacteriales bacterium DFI.9.88]|nr:cobalt-precorrin-5B (C(1))-methyltransferase [Eubacteriales bacterium DFI.9.88]